MEQSQRDFILTEFRTGTSRIFITTDLLPAGYIHTHSNSFASVELFINYDLPTEYEYYLQRYMFQIKFFRYYMCRL